ncbi:MAG: hypothetical protein ACM3JB_03575 [Acidobacteriaceae bacterium]
MRRLGATLLLAYMASLSSVFAAAQKTGSPSENAALRYWSAFSQMQDVGITAQQAKELNAILDGTAPYDDSKYRPLLDKNALALEIMARGTSMPYCEWGLDYGLGGDLPVEYARKALALGRLNVLYGLHLFKMGDKDGAVRALTAGVRFSRDVANGGSLFATLLAKDLLMSHLRAIAGVVKMEQLSTAQRARLQRSVASLGAHGVDWQAAMTREMALLNKPPSQASIPLRNVTQAYLAALGDPSQLTKLQQLIAALPMPLRDVIPGPEQVVSQKQELDDRIVQANSVLKP